MPLQNFAPCEGSGICSKCSFSTKVSGGERCKLFAVGNASVDSGELSAFFVFISSGFVKCSFHLPNGQQQILALHLPGNLLNAPCRFWGGGFDLDESPEASYIAIDKHALEQTSARNGEVLKALETVLRGQLAENLILRMIAGPLTAREKLCSLMVFLLMRQRKTQGKNVTLEFPFGREAIGSLVGLSPETVSRVLTNLRKRGIIDVISRRKVAVLDPELLRSLSPLSDLFAGKTEGDETASHVDFDDTGSRGIIELFEELIPGGCPFLKQYGKVW